jgi:amino acid adenylation domain-containing protein
MMASTSPRSSIEGIEHSLHAGFLRWAALTPDRTALEVDREPWSYGRLRDKACSIAAMVQQRTPPGGSPLTAVFGHRSSTGYAGILGALMAGRGYVPLNRTFPTNRTRWMLETADCRSLIVDSKSEAQLDSLLDSARVSLLVILPERRDVRDLAARWPSHTIVGAADLESANGWEPRPAPPEAIAYLLFTSGSTGTPKGVMVTHGNVSSFLAAVIDRYAVTAEDRLSQMFDASFDLSVFDMFVAWSCGACVCCPAEGAALNPDKFIRASNLSIWFSVPSVGVFMKRFGVLKANRYPSLRWSLFCGEPLPVDVARAWADAAPQSILENMYGPTEVTVACSAYRWDARRSATESTQGIVPIGLPLPGMEALVADETLREVEPGAEGELLMSGPQVTPGYWRNAEATERSYVRPAGQRTIFYRTGDRVRRPVGNCPLTFVGRMDDQVKVLGYRVELGEVESKLREERGIEAAAAIAWPVTSTGAGGVVAFVTGTDINPEQIRTSLEAKLPHYAVPRAVHVLPDLPQNANGKIDRQALLAILRDDSARC